MWTLTQIGDPKKPVISRTELDAPAYAGVHWNPQSSGTSIAAEVAHALEREWGARVGSLYESPPEEVTEPDYWEGAVTPILVNSFERNASARAKCIEHFGLVCDVCKFDFEKRYGLAGKGFIHVHYLVPINDVHKAYRVDPIKDLRPVCPNCHAMIHRREPPYEIDEMQNMLKKPDPLVLYRFAEAHERSANRSSRSRASIRFSPKVKLWDVTTHPSRASLLSSTHYLLRILPESRGSID